MKITQWLKSLVHTEQREMPDMKDIVTDDMVKNALKSDAVTTAVKTQIKSTLDQQIDAAVDTALTDILGSDADNTVTHQV
ncbi:DUF826 domain-containing protein [Salmonella enterica]|uniref:DUF826 domain-containing protein n=1 Tax=Salmonella enterica TaxID=28901 RepID=UPI0038FA35F7